MKHKSWRVYNDFVVNLIIMFFKEEKMMKRKTKIVIADENKEFCVNLSGFLSDIELFVVTGVVHDGMAA